MSEAEKPREFWIVHREISEDLVFNIGPINGENNQTHVIEYQAYEAIKAERDELKSKYDELVSYLPKVPTQPYEKELAQQVNKLREENKRLIECVNGISRAIDWYTNVFGERTKVPQELDHFLVVEIKGNYIQPALEASLEGEKNG